MSALKKRIANLELLIPYGLERMLSLLDIEETTSIPTAAIPIGTSSPRILINPVFVQEHCQEDHCLAALILHEIHHLLLGHTRVFPRITLLHNIAFDAIINAMICRQEPRYGALFTKTYRADSFPECLLRPPQGYPEQSVYPSNLSKNIQKTIHELYLSRTRSFYDIFEVICAHMTCIEVDLTLFGTHDQDVRGFERHDDPALFEAIREIVEEWPMPPMPIIGRSLSGTQKTKTFRYRSQKNPEETIVRAIHKLVHNNGDCTVHNQGTTDRDVQGVWPNLHDRRAFAFSQGGGQPLLFTSPIPEHHHVERCSIYIDVSGSMNSYIEHVSNAVLSCAEYIKDPIYLFSTTIIEINIEEFRFGRYQTTNGTDIAAVAKHIHEKEIRSAVILTDGYVGSIPHIYIESCRRANLQIILTENGFRDDLSPVANELHILGAPQC